ncbi:cyclic nucleotide-binding-like protein [Cladochytrium replicatum]|nr:cyclic nucleotide-binding-like protein [Cladochytrium replicatum]
MIMEPPPNRFAPYSPRLSLARQPHLAPPLPPPPEPSPTPQLPPPPPAEKISMPDDEPFEEEEYIPTLLERFIFWIEQPVDPMGNFFQTWTKLTNILHLFNIIIAPLLFSWTQHFQTLAWVVVFSSVDVIFCIDCFIQSRLHFKNEYGVLIESYAQLRDNYFFRRFGWIQTTSSLPWDLFAFLPTQYSTIHFDSLRKEDDIEFYHYKIWGIIRFVKMLFRAPYERIYEARIAGVALPISRLIKTMVILMVLGHFDAYRWMDAKKLYKLADGTEAEFATQYLTSYLTALRSLVLKLREVNKNAENVFVVFEFIAGILAYGTVFGNIHSIVEMLDHTAASTKAEERHKYEMNWLRQYMRDKGLQPELQKMVNAHKEIQWRRSQGMDEAHLFDDIPKSLQQEIKNYLYLELVQKVPLFQNTDSHFQNSVTFKIKPLVVLNDWYIFRKGDEAEEMYFVKNGTVEICGAEGQVFAKLGPGNFFGEIALFEDTKRTAGARASGTVELCVLTKEDFNQIMNQYPMIAERIRQAIRERKANELAVKQKKEAEAAAAAARPQLSYDEDFQRIKYPALQTFARTPPSRKRR